jgi:hypothetical protein
MARPLKKKGPSKPVPPEPLRRTVTHGYLDSQLASVGGLDGIMHAVVVMLSGKPPGEVEAMRAAVRSRKKIEVRVRIGDEPAIVCEVVS